jgi:hypothetical protein
VIGQKVREFAAPHVSRVRCSRSHLRSIMCCQVPNVNDGGQTGLAVVGAGSSSRQVLPISPRLRRPSVSSFRRSSTQHRIASPSRAANDPDRRHIRCARMVSTGRPAHHGLERGAVAGPVLRRRFWLADDRAVPDDQRAHAERVDERCGSRPASVGVTPKSGERTSGLGHPSSV